MRGFVSLPDEGLPYEALGMIQECQDGMATYRVFVHIRICGRVLYLSPCLLTSVSS